MLAKQRRATVLLHSSKPASAPRLGRWRFYARIALSSMCLSSLAGEAFVSASRSTCSAASLVVRLAESTPVFFWGLRFCNASV
eukprot:480893-Amphidinium_carterae.1